MAEVIFVSGIGTDVGKSYATGWWAGQMMAAGKKVVTQKFIQTGNQSYSEDIDLHRRIMGIEALPEDLDHTTAPVIFSYPASPQLAASIDAREINLDVIDAATKKLAERYDVVLVEGAGGLMVPITDEFLTIDYPLTRHEPVALVSNGYLGSINHTILSLEAIERRGIPLKALLYNTYFDRDARIAEDTQGFIARYLKRHFPEAEMIYVPSFETGRVG